MQFSSASWCAKKQTLVQQCARISEEGNGESNVFTVHTMKMYRGSRGIAHWHQVGAVSLKNIRLKMWFDGRIYSLMQNVYGIICQYGECQLQCRLQHNIFFFLLFEYGFLLSRPNLLNFSRDILRGFHCIPLLSANAFHTHESNRASVICYLDLQLQQVYWIF